MARVYITDMQPGDLIEDQIFLVGSKDLRTTTQGSLYIHAVLRDRTGQVPARLWQATQTVFDGIPEGGFVRVRGRAENYKGNLQFIIDAVRPAETKDVNLEEFLPRTSKDVEQMWARLLEILRMIENEHLLALVAEFVRDETFVASFKRAPAASQLHHAYLGGLLEHTLSVMELAVAVIPCYPDLSRDLVLAGIFFHDMGKTAELSYETNFGYTDAGQLVGHLVQATIWIDRRAESAAAKTGKPFPPDLKAVLQHVVLSHHGTYAFGSPKLPCVPEAVLIHHLDNIDAKMNTMFRLIREDADDSSDWTPYVRSIETRVYKRDATVDAS
ncbi:MAG: CMP-binding protein [Phycisphaerae bacterium]|nr:CMP-binding protein [Phycisphaerae bacterium]